MNDVAGIVEAFGFFVQAFPDNPFASSAYAGRAETTRATSHDAARLNAIWRNLKREREEALQRKALILGQQQNPKGMSDTFRQL